MVDTYDNQSEHSANMTRTKIVLVGDIAVGKSSIIYRILENKFKDNYEVYNYNIAIDRS
jgi:GTPase SAR1 family protein